ncbi:GH92 family glycosyl hydrolase [Aestuariibacter sp. A3R04]|uniref:GH92 family glycosyl hydrolase n=1 Tax=Aestuariibacter sp. A3R04 TaxID=2841571 RepID=UPI001C0A50DF|nr:GH92 family glycosyl hydrolase [Aestuariibacter sp. A3R04]MBU3020525.1 GH92 family glycosyl hydrolase [Aestuariibacter sp. A3R04]
MKYVVMALAALITTSAIAGNSDYVDPFIGTSNFGATHPGAQYPNALASVSPFNVAHGGEHNPTKKDDAWNSRGYISENGFLTGFSHLNLSGVGCPEAGVMLLMPTTGELSLEASEYGTTYSNETAKPGYYRTTLDKYGITAEVTSTLRTGLSRYTFPEGQSHILMNLGLGLTNETGGMVKVVSNTEIEGMRNIGTFCYHPEDVRPVYFVARFSKPAESYGVWKRMPAYKNVEADWISYNDTIKPYHNYLAPMAGDDVGTWFSFNTRQGEQIQVKVGISFVSIENARANLDTEQPAFDFNTVQVNAQKAWDSYLNRVNVKGEHADKVKFYTALYHTLIHPNIFQDANGDYPLNGAHGVGNSGGKNRYTVYSLWDTNRNVHPLLSLLYPELQEEMVNSAIAMAKESGWLPKWELYGMETEVMVGDPATAMIADTYLRGIQDFDVDAAYIAMQRAADQKNDNLLRPENADYLALGYVPFDDEGPYDGSVSTSLEYYVADFSLAQLARVLGKQEDHQRYLNRAMKYKTLFDSKTGMLRPKNRKGEWLTPYDPELGRNFEPAPGYIEGNAWNYRFYVPFDTPGLIGLLGGEEAFIEALDATFDTGNFDMANEPDITYPFLYNFVQGKEYRTGERVHELINEHFLTTPGGIPGNDDTGTLSAWLVFSMMGIYPVSPGVMDYAVFTPSFSEITISLNDNIYEGKKLVIKKGSNGAHTFNGKPLRTPFISHNELTGGGELTLH